MTFYRIQQQDIHNIIKENQTYPLHKIETLFNQWKKNSKRVKNNIMGQLVHAIQHIKKKKL
jgi:ribosomal protein S17E